MGPAIRIPRSRGLIAAKALTSAATIEPDSKPIPGWLVVQNNRVAHRVLEWPLTGRLGQARERRAAVSGNRRSGDVDRVGVAAS